MPCGNPETRKAPPWMAAKRKDAMNACRTLYGYRRLGWECGDGWNAPLAELSYALEELNLRFYGKYRTKIVAEQVKEKFGTLRFYYVVVTQQPLWRRLPGMALGALAEFIKRKTDFKFRRVVVENQKTVHEYELLPEKSGPDAAGAVSETYEGKSGKRYSVRKYSTPARSEYVPSRHRIIYAAMTALFRAKARIASWLETAKPTKTQIVVSEYMENEADRLIKRAENECFGKCEKCGKDIGCEWSPRYETPGWITYVCEDCAPDGSKCYDKDGKTLVKGKDAPEDGQNEDKA